ncbi:MAG: hypothetical protein K8I29_19305 [Alphaproteobacteria bacterium]|uniref:Uncharacterized protein n=1 Tax=Candidatus Nitrobium versatile TaxID=2884831 RepID=A0A953SDT5_9BACT|nr:hypothetical protein [Candidatus Nitrobium versatile]
MKKFSEHLGNEKGFIHTVILGAIVLAIAMAALWANTGKTNSSLASSKAAYGRATSVIEQGATFRLGFETIVANGVASSSVTFNTNSSTGLLNPSLSGISQQYPDKTLLATTTNTWVYKVDGSNNPVVKVQGIGVDASADYMVILPDLTQAACQNINQAITGSTSIPAPAAGTLAAWSTAATAIDLSADAAINKLSEACVQTTDTKYVYYKVLSEV